MKLLALVAIVGTLPFQQPLITNGTVVPVASTIERAVAAAAAESAPSWVAWMTPAVNGRSQSCCWYSNNDDRWYGCGLEPRAEGAPQARPPQPVGPVPLEGGTSLLILARVVPTPDGASAAGGNIERVRAFSDDCPLDAGGRTVRMVENVTPDAGVRFLSDLIAARPAAEGRSSVHNNALSAIAGTAGPAASAALDTLAGSAQPAKLRKQAIFWIGQSRGSEGFTKLNAMLGRETDADVRRSIIQAISRSAAPEAVPALLAIAKNDADPKNRGEALFWVAQRAGKSVAAEISAAAQNDPDTKVQERAVMALSQLPKDEGVPLLIGLARTHKTAKVRERAMFWLGQSKDPRALKFFEEILMK